MRDDLRKKVELARKDELEAASFYNQLASLAPNTNLAQVLSSIAADEYAHARILTTILVGPLTVGSQVPNVNASHRNEFRQRLEKALEGELEAISEYAELASTASGLQQKMIFLSIAGDEYGHARTLIAMLNMPQH